MNKLITNLKGDVLSLKITTYNSKVMYKAACNISNIKQFIEILYILEAKYSIGIAHAIHQLQNKYPQLEIEEKIKKLRKLKEEGMWFS